MTGSFWDEAHKVCPGWYSNPRPSEEPPSVTKDEWMNVFTTGPPSSFWAIALQQVSTPVTSPLRESGSRGETEGRGLKENRRLNVISREYQDNIMTNCLMQYSNGYDEERSTALCCKLLPLTRANWWPKGWRMNHEKLVVYPTYGVLYLPDTDNIRHWYIWNGQINLSSQALFLRSKQYLISCTHG
jgi:hypothetical protein